MSNTHGDSPTKARHTHSSEYRSWHVADSRKTLTRDIPEVPEVYLDSLMDAVLPSLPPETLNGICNALETAGHIKDPDTPNSRWRCLPLDPCVNTKPETEKFRFLDNVSQAIIESYHSFHHMEPTLTTRLQVTGQITPLGNRRNTSRPDGYFQVIIEDPGPRQSNWADIVMPMEFKNVHNRQNQIDDFGKVMWSMHHIMRNDARRRYVHGLTCENTKVRLWYNDRADVVASQEFDVNKDWKFLVRIILSVLLAEGVELGYNPNIQLVPSNNLNSEPSYDITIRNPDTQASTIYRTVGIISDVGADSMVGRGTRVWEVRKLVDGELVGTSYALKDTWVHEDRVPEHKLIQKFRSEQPDYAQHFLTPIDYGFAPFDPAQPLVLDNTHTTLRRKELVPTRKLLPTHSGSPSAVALHITSSRSLKTTSSVRDSVGHLGDIPDSPSEGHQVFLLGKYPRQHYLTVFEEIGTPIHKLRNFAEVFTAIQGGWEGERGTRTLTVADICRSPHDSEGLHAIHLCKYVHRDVSSGNILLVPPKGPWGERGVIMDLEYGKDINDTRVAHNVRTGTVLFMATEVALIDHHRFRTIPSPGQTSNSREVLESIAESLMEQTLEPPQKPIQVPPFRHNQLHDMESIWWLCMWMMFHLIQPSKNRQDQINNYHHVFCSAESKVAFICGSGLYRKFTSHLSEHQTWVDLMERWSQILNNLYSTSYGEHDTSAIPPNQLRICDKDIQTSYKLGKGFLLKLHQASTSLSDFVTLS
ncbi:unnamed protein product [Rhizoctonia solani]|uniref:Fungal-type protein kinase domain-containing protein n=1 Tax=Rhizoctonia solani TaxID=456999 RepID=A0A8H3A935_9AGAM|nr:unnamed protein product [Rhizoctonia solani]